LDVHKTSLTFPKIEQYALGDQVRRASKSICANIAEGFGRQAGSTPEFKRFLQMAIGSGNEMIVWVKYCRELGYITEQKALNWEGEYLSICKMMTALRSKADRR
jgi:four helix bundle protein